MTETTMTESELERERTRNYELGRISQLEDVAEELRERAGEAWAEADHHKETAKAKQLKDLARELEERAESGRDSWDEKYK